MLFVHISRTFVKIYDKGPHWKLFGEYILAMRSIELESCFLSMNMRMLPKFDPFSSSIVVNAIEPFISKTKLPMQCQGPLKTKKSV